MDLMLGMILGVIGSAYFVYGRKQRHAVALISGIALVVFPMFVSQALWLIIGGLAFVALPFVLTL